MDAGLVRWRRVAGLVVVSTGLLITAWGCAPGRSADVVVAIVNESAKELGRGDDIAVVTSMPYRGGDEWQLTVCGGGASVAECGERWSGDSAADIDPTRDNLLIERVGGVTRVYRLDDHIEIPRTLTLSGDGLQWLAFRLVRTDTRSTVQLVELSIGRPE